MTPRTSACLPKRFWLVLPPKYDPPHTQAEEEYLANQWYEPNRGIADQTGVLWASACVCPSIWIEFSVLTNP